MRYDNTYKKQINKLSKYAYLGNVNFAKIRLRIHVPNRVGENHEPIIGRNLFFFLFSLLIFIFLFSPVGRTSGSWVNLDSGKWILQV